MIPISEKYVNPFTDFGFKKLFGEEPNKDLLIDFLNSLIPDQTIKNLTYHRVDRQGLTPDFRKPIFDLYCENEEGEKFIVEIQKVKQNYFKDRSLFYSTFPIQEQAVAGVTWDFKLKAVYFIGILDFVFDDKDKDKAIVTEVKLLDTKSNKVFYDKLTFIYLQIPNFNKTEMELETHFEKWLFVFRYLQKLQERPKVLQEKVFEKLFKIAEIAKFDYAKRMDYEEEINAFRDMKNSVDTALDDGIEIGKVKGSNKRALEIAKEMILENEPVDKIIKYTKLTKLQIENLIIELKSSK